MSDESTKIAEAEFFLNLLHRATVRDNMQEVKYYLSAFLSASRCVLQYALDEIKQNGPSQQIWYDKKVANDLFRLFKELRDNNIHKKSASYSKDCTVCVGMTLLDRETLETTCIAPTKNDFVKYYIREWPKNEDLTTIATNYLNELKGFVREGVAKGFISG